jgi:cytochrome b561
MNVMPASPAPPARYGIVARLFHWVTALAILAIVILGIWIAYFEPAEEAFKLRLYGIHESLGFSVLLLTLLRLAWRQASPPPELPTELPEILRLAAHANHIFLYVVLIAQPVVGFLSTNAWGFPFKLWGVLAVPSPIGPSEPLGELLSAIHWWLALALVGAVAVHAGAAIWHQYVRRDGTLSRML